MLFLVLLGWSWLVQPSEAECHEDGKHLTCRENDSFPNTSLPLVEVINWAASAAGPSLKDLRDLLPNVKVVARLSDFSFFLLPWAINLYYSFYIQSVFCTRKGVECSLDVILRYHCPCLEGYLTSFLETIIVDGSLTTGG